MNLEQLVILLPCHSFEDFPQHHRGEEAAGLLAGWTALWHPSLLAVTNRAPVWYRADDPPQDLQGKLIVVPSVSQRTLAADLPERAAQQNAVYITTAGDRPALLERALQAVDSPSLLEGDLVGDFLALGYAFLQIQLLTRQMRYSSSLDEVNFNQQLLAAAKAAVAGDESEARNRLSTCFSLLAEERDHFYAVDAFLLDLTLLTPAQLGAALRHELQAIAPVNLLLSGELLGALIREHSETGQALKDGLAAERVGLVGGEYRELCLPLLSCESILAELLAGLRLFESQLGRRVDIYGRRRFGVTPVLPQILDRLGFRGACHATLDGGRFPQGTQSKTRWEGADGATIDALAKPPLDASKPETFLALGTKLGESMDMDHVATLCFAHWAGTGSPWYEDLRRCARYCSALGRFHTVEAYFRNTYVPGHVDRFDADQYRSPYLRQAVESQQSDPVSSIVRYWQQRTAAETAEALAAILAPLGQRVVDPCDARLRENGSPPADQPSADQPPAESLDPLLAATANLRAQQLADSLPQAETGAQGCLVINPHSFSRRIGLELPQLASPPAVGRPIYAADEAAGIAHAVVDVPAMGFLWVAPARTSSARLNEPVLAESRIEEEGMIVLRNEFFEARVHGGTGALVSLKNYDSRTNRLSQQLAFRAAGPRKRLSYADQPDTGEYSRMVADRVAVTRATRAIGEVLAEGRLLDRQGQLLADFRQRFLVWRGRRVLELTVELDSHVTPGPDPWSSYYACRFAWADEAAELTRSLNQTRRGVQAQRIETPHYLEIASGEERTAILTGGLPYHRRAGPRMLDTLLVVRGESQRSFRLGIGFDLAYPLQESIALLAEPLVVPATAAPSVNTGWFFHLDAKNVVATHWSPLVEDERVCGVRSRLLETAGRSAQVRLSCCRPLVAARQTDFRGNSRGNCRLDAGRAVIDMTAHQWVEAEIRWE